MLIEKIDKKISRRHYLEIFGKLSVITTIAAVALGAVKAFIPKVLYEPSAKFKIGKPADFPEGITFLSKYKLYIFRNGNDFHAVSAICTHLNCVADWKPDQQEFYCSCHGSVFAEDGVNLEGPAPRPLIWHPLSFAPDGNFFIETNKQVTSEYKYSL